MAEAQTQTKKKIILWLENPEEEVRNDYDIRKELFDALKHALQR